MKKPFLYILLTTLLSCLLPACTADDYNAEQERFLIGISQCSDDNWRRKMNEELQREAAINHCVELEIRSANDNDQTQIDDIDYFIRQKVDLIIVAPNTTKAISPAIKRALDSHIPIILVDRSIDSEDPTAYIGANNFEIGEMVGEYVASRLEHKGKVFEVTGLKESSPAKERHRGFVQALSDESGIELSKVVHCDWTYPSARRMAESLAPEMLEADLVFAHNDPMALGIQSVLDSIQPGNDVLIVGVDALPGPNMGAQWVKDKKLDASFIYPTRGDLVMETALKILRKEPYSKNIILPTALVDASNANILLMQAREIDTQTEKMMRLNELVDTFWDRYSIQKMFLIACIIIIVLFIILLIVVLRSYHAKVRTAELLARQTKELERQREEVKAATSAKLSFFTSVSHDFRTPLTLISDPIRILKKSGNISEAERSILNIAHKNVHILLRLINQILDIRKFDSGKLKLNVVNANLRDCITDWTNSFQQVAQSRHIHLSLDCGEGNWNVAFDPEKMERIVFNLLSNAIKFTPENGKIHVRLSQEASSFVLQVTDSGSGIKKEDVQKIFDTYYQTDSSQKQNSSGIGLSLVKVFVELHGGTISVDSEYGKGSEFTCRFPLRQIDNEAPVEKSQLISTETINEELASSDTQKIDEIINETTMENGKPILLIIDDNSDMRTYIHTILQPDYNIIEAANGKQGVALANKYLPDIVICDMMMPVMDGLECCHILKSEMRTSHIPVLMLTACSFDEQRVASYENGADGFIGKPFDSQVLCSRIHSLLDNRKRIKDFLSESQPSETETDNAKAVSDIDKDFILQFKQIVQEQIADNNLSVETIGGQMGLSRVQLYRKVKSLTNYSPVELIRIIRLKKAQMLLSTEKKLTVAEVSYRVGFSSPSYFTKCYKEYFNESPTATQERLA